MNSLRQLILIQFKEFFRKPGVLFWAFVFPILMAWGLGIAFTKKGEVVRYVAVVEDDIPNNEINIFLKDTLHFQSTADIDERIKILGNEKLGNINYHFITSSWEKAILMLKRGKATLILQEKEDGIKYHFDPLNPEAQLTYLQLSAAINNNTYFKESKNIQPLTQVGTRYIDFLVPGLMAMSMMMSAMWGVSYTLIDKRMKKLLRRMIATPMKKSEFLFSHFVGRSVLSAVEAMLLLGFSWLYFDISIQGSITALIVIFLAGNMAFAGLAIFVSSRTSNTQIGNGLINVITMPMMICSGIFFSYHNFPEWLIPIIRHLPLTMLADSIRSIFIEGANFQEVWYETIILCGTGIIFFTIGLKIYKWY